jgi:exosome complex RNA-binding protein Csl4
VYLKSGPASLNGIEHVKSRCTKCGEEFEKYGDTTLCDKCNA